MGLTIANLAPSRVAALSTFRIQAKRPMSITASMKLTKKADSRPNSTAVEPSCLRANPVSHWQIDRIIPSTLPGG